MMPNQTPDPAPPVPASLADSASDPHPTFGGLADVKGSATIGTLVAALAKAYLSMTHAIKDSLNPAFRAKYASLTSCLDAVRAPLAENGLTLLQPATTDGAKVRVTSLLAHVSGEWLAATMEIPAGQPNAHGIGSALTYAKRYSLTSLLALGVDDDDDANGAMVGADTRELHTAPPPPPPPVTRPTPAPTTSSPSPRRAKDGEGFISEAQGRRFYAISKHAGWSDDALRVFLADHGHTSSKTIPWRDYDGIIREIEAGPREPEQAPF